MNLQPIQKRLRLALTALFLVVAGVPAQAKIVAIVFDTSGSMEGRYQLPSFGARLLAGTIDGRAGFDQLLIMNFNEYWQQMDRFRDAGLDPPRAATIGRVTQALPNAIQRHDITSAVQHQSVVGQLNGKFRYDRDTGTPYGPIEVMLDRIVQEVESGDQDEVILIVVSDGEYTPDDDFRGGRLVNQLRQNYEAYRDRISAAGATLQAEFLFIDQTGGSNLVNVVREQGVRDTLLEAFNGSQRNAQGQLPGSHYVASGPDLWSALQDIIASVAGTDRKAQSAFISANGSEITLTSPLSISRIVMVSTAEQGQKVPTRTSDNFSVNPSDRRRIETEARGSDPAFPLTRPRKGIVEHLYFQNALPADTYALQFDAPVTDDVFLLFETRSIIDLQIFDDDGNEVLPGQDGVRTLFKDSTYRFNSRILDGDGTPQVVDLDNLPPSLTMTLTLSAPTGPDAQSMTVDRAADQGSFEWTPGTLGELIAFSRASAGILSPQSPRLELRVLDPVTTLEVTPIRPTNDCNDCDEGQISSPVENTDDDVPVGEFDVTADGDRDGAIQFDDPGEGFEIRDQDGNVITPGQDVPFGQDETRTFTLWRKGPVDPGVLAQGSVDIDIAVTPSGGWLGNPISNPGEVLLTPPDMSLKLVDVTQGLTPSQTDGLRVPGGELQLGQFAAQFSLIDIVVQPDPETIEDIAQATSNRWIDNLVSFDLSLPDPRQTGFNALDVRPRTNFLCLCWLWGNNELLGTERRSVSVNYQVVTNGVVLQQADAVVPMEFPISRARGSWSCFWNLVALFLAYVTIRWLIAMITTYRFPKKSRVEIVEPNERVRYVPLGKGNKVWLKGWLAWARGNPDEVRIVEGLRLRATSNGAILDIAKNTPNWELDSAGAPFSELKELHPKKTEYKVNWDDRFESLNPPGRTLYLRKGRGSI